MFLKLALRNITAYKNRSSVTVLLTSITTALLVFSSAWMDGSHFTMIKNAVEIYPGYIQITGNDFRDTPSYDNLIFTAPAIAAKLDKNQAIASFGSRFESFVLFAGADKAVGGMLTGIEPEKEKQLSRLAASLHKGEYLKTTDTNQLYIGVELARRLHVDVGDELAFVGNGADYSFAADTLIVKGIFKTGLFDFDAGSAFLAKDYFAQIMAAEHMATHFIILPKHPEQATELASAIGQDIGPDYQTASWNQTMAGLVKAMQLDSVFGYITLAIIFIVIFFVIMIYTLLAVFARIREIGILRAIGTTPKQIMALLLMESSILAFISVLIGGVLGGACAYYFHIYPIVFAGMEEQFKQYGLAASAMPTAFMPLVILRDMLVMFCLSILSSLYPIIKVNGYKPVEAIHHV